MISNILMEIMSHLSAVKWVIWLTKSQSTKLSTFQMEPWERIAIELVNTFKLELLLPCAFNSIVLKLYAINNLQFFYKKKG